MVPFASMFQHQGMHVWRVGDIDIDNMFREFRSPLVGDDHIFTGFWHAQMLCQVGLFPCTVQRHLQFVDMMITAHVDYLFDQTSFPGIGSQGRTNC